MANFPIERARERLGFVPTTAVRADIDVRTGGGELAQVVSGFGKALIDLGVKYDLKEANTQFSEYKRNVEMSRMERDIEIKKELDQSKHEAIFKRYAEDQKGLMPTNRRAIQAANIWNNQQAPIQKQALVNARIFQTKDNEKTEVFEFQAEVAAGTKTIEKFEKFFARLIKIDRDNPDDTPPTFTNLEAAKILADTRNMAIKAQHDMAVSAVHAAIEAKNFGLAKELAKNPIIPEPEQTTLRTAIRTAGAVAENEQKNLTDIYVEQSHKTAVTELVKDVNNVAFTKDMPESLREFWQEKLNKRAAGLEEGIDTFNQYDPVLYNGLKQQIRETPDKVDYMDIIDSVGNGLTPPQAQELFELQDKMQRKDSPLNQSHIKRAHDRINDLQTEGLPIKGIEPPTAKSTPEEAIAYMNVFDEMHEAIDRNTDLNPTEMRKYTEEMVRPVAEEAGKGFWGILKQSLGWQPTTYGFALGAAYINRERLLRTQPIDRSDFERKFKELYKVDPDTANKYWDRWNDE